MINYHDTHVLWGVKEKVSFQKTAQVLAKAALIWPRYHIMTGSLDLDNMKRWAFFFVFSKCSSDNPTKVSIFFDCFRKAILFLKNNNIKCIRMPLVANDKKNILFFFFFFSKQIILLLFLPFWQQSYTSQSFVLTKSRILYEI